MIRTYSNTSNIFLRVGSIYSYEEALDLYNNITIIKGSLTKTMITELNRYYEKFGKNYKERKEVFLKTIEVLLPGNYNQDYLEKHISTFSNQVLHGLPYISYLRRDRDLLFLSFIVCERTYYKSQKKVSVLESHDIYKRKTENGMKFCRKSDSGAILIAKKGDIKSSSLQHFSHKNRLFAGNKKTFDILIQFMKEKWLFFFSSLGIVKEAYFLKGINIKLSYDNHKINFFRLRNITLLNRLKIKINNDLDRLFTTLDGMRIDETQRIKAYGFFNKWKLIWNECENYVYYRTDYCQKIYTELKKEWEFSFHEILSNYCQTFL